MGLNIRYPALVMKTGSGQVNAGAPGGTLAGWLSGAPASAAISATVTTVFDLGPDWQQYGLLQIALKRSQALTSINAYASDDGVANAQPLCATTGSALAMTLTAAGDEVATALPSGRYVRIVTVNGATAQDATAVDRVTAMPA